MSQTTLGEMLGFLRRTCEAGSRELTDDELLERFLTRREEAAFTILLQRHGPMVLGVCRRLLGDAQAAEDCFQATFMVLVRRAASIQKKQALTSWLYGVAQRIALRARAQAALRRHHERRAAPMPRAPWLDDLTWQELRAALDEEIGRLPEKYREPVVLCYLGNKSHAEAAGELGCPKSSLAQRLSQARQLLHGQLKERGITLAAGAVTTVLAEGASGAPLPALLTINTVKAAASMIAGQAAPALCISRHALTLAEEALQPMLTVKSKLAVLLVAMGLALGGGWAAAGALVLPRHSEAQQPQPLQGGDLAQKDIPAPVDRLDDPLPKGALARLGTVRFRHGFNTFGVAFAPGEASTKEQATDQ
jgi:RNA polymerase sigma factor (sigma-70 family)